MSTNLKRIAILGAGPSGMMVYKQLIESEVKFEITIFEKTEELGNGMPYSKEGANVEHITNVSDNEIPEIVTSISDWIKTVPAKTLEVFNIDPENFTSYHVLPRLLFGQYLSAQFDLLHDLAKEAGITTKIHRNTEVTDITDQHEKNEVWIEVAEKGIFKFDIVIICTGHKWPRKHEGKIPGYFDSPYPPVKLQQQINHPIAVMGSSLTAIDAIRTLARSNGTFHQSEDGKLVFTPFEESKKFKIVMHSRNGLLPTIRFHLDEPQLTRDSLLTHEEIRKNKAENGGFLSLDFVFEKNFIEGFIKKDPKFYQKIKNMSIEEFVGTVMAMRQRKDAFQLFREEYKEAERSIEKRESVYWKEMLAELSYTMNYPAKYLSAEDMMRLKKVLMPLISVVIAFVPQSSCVELFALNDAGKLDIISVGEDSKAEPKEAGGVVYKYTDDEGKSHTVNYNTFINCVGQTHFPFEEFPFEGLKTRKTVSPAFIRFKSNEEGKHCLEEGNNEVVRNANGDYFLKVSGIAINDHFQVENEYTMPNERVYIMAVPYIGGYNPDYSGLDFCEEAAVCIVEGIKQSIKSTDSKEVELA